MKGFALCERQNFRIFLWETAVALTTLACTTALVCYCFYVSVPGYVAKRAMQTFSHQNARWRNRNQYTDRLTRWYKGFRRELELHWEKVLQLSVNSTSTWFCNFIPIHFLQLNPWRATFTNLVLIIRHSKTIICPIQRTYNDQHLSIVLKWSTTPANLD